MTNEELGIAIENTRLARYRTNETDSLYATLTNHLEHLLIIQIDRATQTEVERIRNEP